MNLAENRRTRFAALAALAAAPFGFYSAVWAGNGKFRLVVSFSSICCGTNHQAQKKLETFVTRFEKTLGKKLAVERRHWGKEGEFDLAFPLSELGPEPQKKFIADLRSVLAGEKQVDVRENAVPNPGR